MHRNIKLCIDTQFDVDPSKILKFDEIMEMCVGQNYSILFRFYTDINFVVKEITKEKIKNNL